MNQPFTPICHLDTWALSSSLRGKLGLFEPAEGERSGSSFLAQGAALAEWRALFRFAERLKKLDPSLRIEQLRIWRLAPGENIGWGLPLIRIAVIPIVTNPSCWFFCGPHGLHLPVGALTVLDATWPHCAINCGEQPHFHLWAEFRQKEIRDE